MITRSQKVLWRYDIRLDTSVAKEEQISYDNKFGIIDRLVRT